MALEKNLVNIFSFFLGTFFLFKNILNKITSKVTMNKFIKKLKLIDILFLFFCFFYTQHHQLSFGSENFSKKNKLLDYSAEQSANMRSLESFAISLHQLSKIYIDKKSVEVPNLIDSAISGMVNSLDSNTIYLNQKQFMQLYGLAQGRYGGIGIILSQQNSEFIILSTVENSPAKQAGIISGDILFKINGTELTPNNSKDQLDIIRGEPGSKIKITIKRKKKLIDLKLTRQVIAQSSVFSKMLSEKIGYIKVTNFQEDTAQNVQYFINQNKNSLKGLIIDLRNNPGGLLNQAVNIVDMFVETGVIVSTIGRDKKNVDREYAYKAGTFQVFDIAILVNSRSASASEIVAGALQDHKRAKIIGQKTYGKGSVQTLVALPYGGGLKITIARYYTPNGSSIEKRGITPDFYIPSEEIKNQIAADDNYKKDTKKTKDLKEINNDKESKKIIKTYQNLLKGSKDKISSWQKHDKKDWQLKIAYMYLHNEISDL